MAFDEIEYALVRRDNQLSGRLFDFYRLVNESTQVLVGTRYFAHGLENVLDRDRRDTLALAPLTFHRWTVRW